MTRSHTIGFLVAIIAVGVTATLAVQRVVAAELPTKGALTYTGYLESENGTPVTTEQMIGLAAYDSLTAGTKVCDVEAKPITPFGGRFQIQLPDTCLAAVSSKPELWIEVSVGAIPLGRTKLGAVPYAVEAGHAATASSAAAAASAAVAASATLATTASSAATAASAAVAQSIAAGAVSKVYDESGENLGPSCAVFKGSTAIVDCTCPSGMFVVAGGGHAKTGSFIRESGPLGTSVWRTICASISGDELCNGYKLLCIRLGSQ